ncbi:MAG: diguanylate cyclase [Gammaproteobacteria bacterium]|jgi:two-component system, cell cycle response regulator|nr:diguanylate cyclase [Gammaproteobacteria bacterium]MBT3722095.1 diguanylate cyclase [Gammaproteobacteria bacterium]MBT4075973.1 diguanylate cyclase [Gammaproteobacteria bacterium]MBT4195987.1 diguanylate cyclase [Gammaproteobacteria bacterium]MBT4451541.1 diguanylate cyclase [Gammaproteobacteria bacterium]
MYRLNLKFISILFILLFTIISSALYQQQKMSAVNEAEKRIEIFMKKWLALFHYVEVEQKEVFYQLEKEGTLTKKSYFNPKVLSFTYIARQIQEKYEENEKANGKIPYNYRIAATTPRNSVNLATEHEAEILTRFRNDEIDKFTEFLYRDSEKFYTSYTPIERTTKSCMRCHSTPDKAPTGLVERYGTEAGFGESEGVIRGMIIMEIPFSEIEKEAFNNFALTLFIIIFVFAGFFMIIKILITKDKKLLEINNELEKLSNTDMLTNIANRRYFDKKLSQQWKLMGRVKKPISLILCDIDFFKTYNDTYGHQKGDTCLALVAQAISSAVKRPNDIVARYGGEEFVIVLPDTDNNSAINIAEKIQRNVSDLNINHSASTVSPIVTLSMGISTLLVTKHNSHDTLLGFADDLLYQAKDGGRNCYKAEVTN